MDEQKPAAELITRQQILAVNIPKIYSNGFLIGLTLSDINITLAVNNQPTHQVIMSLISAKGLMNALNKAIEDFEEKTGTKIPEMEDLKKAFEAKKNN